MKIQIVRRCHVGLIALAVACVSCRPSEPSEADEAALRKLITEDFKKAWDAYDEAAMAQMFLADADIAFPTGAWIKGKDGIQNALNLDVASGTTGAFEIESLRFLDGTIAIVNVNAHFSGGKAKDGSAVPDYWDAATAIMKKQDGNWKYAALRVMPARMEYEKVRMGVEDSWNRFKQAFEKGDAEGCASVFTAKAINMPPGVATNVNQEEVLGLFKDYLANNKIARMSFTSLELDFTGPVARQYGTFEQEVIPKKGKTYVQKGRYFAVWNLEGDGTWRFHRFIFNDVP